jgi:malonate transporter and related proteins
VIDLIAQSAVPCALFAMGLALRRYGIFGDLKMSAVVTALKLLIHPLIVWLLVTFRRAHAARVRDRCGPVRRDAVRDQRLSACRAFQTGVAAAAGAVTLSTTLSMLTISFWLWMTGVGG